MNWSKILLIAFSLVLIVCLVLVVHSCVAERSVFVSPVVAVPVEALKPVPTFAQSPTPETDPELTPESDPEVLPFAEEKGFSFEAPEEQSIPAVQATSTKGARFGQVQAIVSAPQITCSEPDEEDMVTWEIRYTTTAGASLVVPSGKDVDAYCVFAGGYDLIDYDTGRILNSRDSGNLLDERTYTRETELATEDGSFTVRVSEQAKCSWDEWQFVQNENRVSAINRVIVEAILTVRAPADYEGLILGLDVENAGQIPHDPFSENTARIDVPEIWDGNPEDWIFVRAVDWIDEIWNEAEDPAEWPDWPDWPDDESEDEEADEETDEEEDEETDEEEDEEI